MKNNKTALITGASSGIGLEFAKIFAKNNYNLVLVARDMEKISADIFAGAEVILISKDLSQEGAAKEIFDEITNKNIQIDSLVNNAGFGDYGFFHESNLDKQRQMIHLNVQTLTELTHYFLGGMVKRKSGEILNVASTAAFQPGPLMSVYYATKAYVLSFSEAIANEVAAGGVKVTVLCPGATASNFQSAAAMGESKLVKGKKLPTAKAVAEYGFASLKKGKVVAVPGLKNYIMANSVRFAPRRLVTALARRLQDRSR